MTKSLFLVGNLGLELGSSTEISLSQNKTSDPIRGLTFLKSENVFKLFQASVKNFVAALWKLGIKHQVQTID
jgi:hypothetical protein